MTLYTHKTSVKWVMNKKYLQCWKIKKDAPSTDLLGTKEDKDFLFVLIPISIHLCPAQTTHFCIDELMNFCAKNIFYSIEAHTEINTIYPHM